MWAIIPRRCASRVRSAGTLPAARLRAQRFRGGVQRRNDPSLRPALRETPGGGRLTLGKTGWYHASPSFATQGATGDVSERQQVEHAQASAAVQSAAGPGVAAADRRGRLRRAHRRADGAAALHPYRDADSQPGDLRPAGGEPVRCPASSIRPTETYQQAIAIDPQQAAFYVALARVQVFNGQPEDAAHSAQDALLIDPNAAQAHGVYAWALDFMGGEENLTKAREEIERGAADRPQLGADPGLPGRDPDGQQPGELQGSARRRPPGGADRPESAGGPPGARLRVGGTASYDEAMQSYETALRINPTWPCCTSAWATCCSTRATPTAPSPPTCRPHSWPRRPSSRCS